MGSRGGAFGSTCQRSCRSGGGALRAEPYLEGWHPLTSPQCFPEVVPAWRACPCGAAEAARGEADQLPRQPLARLPCWGKPWPPLWGCPGRPLHPARREHQAGWAGGACGGALACASGRVEVEWAALAGLPAASARHRREVACGVGTTRAIGGERAANAVGRGSRAVPASWRSCSSLP